jgi:alpha-tubulin suppressor-like RCC1 family protein
MATAMLATALTSCDQLATAPSQSARFTEVSAGEQHSCAVSTDGAVWCWGDMRFGRLGQTQGGTCEFDVCTTPVRVMEGGGLSGLDAGGKHNCAISNRTAYCWGFNWRGQLGTGFTEIQRCEGELPCSIVPLPVALGFPIEFVSAGMRHSCAITETHDAFCWGYDRFDQLGGGGLARGDSTHDPMPVVGDHEFVDIAAGTSHTCAIDTDALAWCWGTDLEGRLGLGVIKSSAVPAPVAGDLRVWDPGRRDHLYWTDIDAGNAHTCGITVDGETYCWGIGGGGRLGDSTGISWWWPVRAEMPGRTIDISAGDTHTCAVQEDGSAWCWGINDSGQLGTGDIVWAYVPVQVVSDEHFVSISAGRSHTCALTDEGRVFCWGENEAGQVGAGNRWDHALPQQVN